MYANATVKSQPMKEKTNDLTEIIAQTLNEMKTQQQQNKKRKRKRKNPFIFKRKMQTSLI